MELELVAAAILEQKEQAETQYGSLWAVLKKHEEKIQLQHQQHSEEIMEVKDKCCKQEKLIALLHKTIEAIQRTQYRQEQLIQTLQQRQQ
jgi:hypothetical protein